MLNNVLFIQKKTKKNGCIDDFRYIFWCFIVLKMRKKFKRDFK